MATELKDTILLAELSSGDMVAKYAVYHKHCLAGLFTWYRSSIHQNESSVFDDKLSCEAMALAELVSYIEEMRQIDEWILILSSIVHLYQTHLEQLGGETLNATRLKEKLVIIPDPKVNMKCYSRYWRYFVAGNQEISR